MKRLATILVFLALAAALAGAEINFGAGAGYESGSSVLSPVVPQVFVERIYSVGPWETFGVDLVLGGWPLQKASYVNGLGAGPELFFGTDFSYHFPALGPADLALLIGGWGFQDYENRANGIAAQTGVSATLRLGSYFVQGRGLYRFFSSTGLTGSPVPLGSWSFALLGGWSLL